jgi:hypothetical protein
MLFSGLLQVACMSTRASWRQTKRWLLAKALQTACLLLVTFCAGCSPCAAGGVHEHEGIVEAHREAVAWFSASASALVTCGALHSVVLCFTAGGLHEHEGLVEADREGTTVIDIA